MTFLMNDGRLLARIINLAHRFGCSYSSVRARASDGRFRAAIELHGPEDALRRLQRQVNKLINDDKEFSP
jgi:hypothetical protein